MIATMNYANVCQAWDANPASLQQVFAVTDTRHLLEWADLAAAERRWVLASMLNTSLLHKIVAMQLHCACQAAAAVRAGGQR